MYLVASRDRFPVLMNLLNDPQLKASLSLPTAESSAPALREAAQGGVQCGMLSGEITQAKQTKTLENFKSGRSKILVATDVAGGASTLRDFSRGQLQPS